MTRINPLATLGILLSTLSAGCVLEDMDIGVDVQGICDPEECGNSAMSNGYPASELNQDGRWSAQGFRLLGYTDGDTGNALTVDVHDSEFYLLAGTSGVWAPFSTQTSAIIIHLERDNGDPMTPEYHSIRVQTAPWLDSWVLGAASVPAYHMSYWDNDMDPEDRGWKPFCSELVNGVETMTRAALIVGERYDLDTREVLPQVAGDDGWYNIACEAGALLKNKRLGYDPELMPFGTATSPDQRQSAWRMMNAAYCGDETSYTKNGTPLYWENEYGWFPPPAAGTLEAAWGPDGAICLDNPRHPQLWDKACAIPACNGVVPANAMWWTTNPQ